MPLTPSAQVATGASSTVNVATGQPVILRAGGQGDLIVSELQARYYEGVYRGMGFGAATQSVATTTVGLALTYTGLVISNPVGSSINMVLTKASVMQSVIQATQPEAYGIAVGFNASTNVTHTAAVTPVSSKVGSGLSAVGKADSSATLPTAPTYHTFVQNTASATVLGGGSVVDFEGSVILMPGAYALWVTPAQASVAGLWFSFDWLEIPL